MSEQLHTQQWLCFQLGSETYAQRVGQVQEIRDYISPVPIPGAPDCVEGVLNVRGEIVTIVSGQSMLALPDAHSCAHIIVLETEMAWSASVSVKFEKSLCWHQKK